MITSEKCATNILEDVYSVSNYKEHHINTNNNGILNRENVIKQKTKLLKESIEYLTDDLVTDIQHYPENDISKVELDIDFVVMKRKEFEYVKNVLFNLIEEKNNNKQAVTNE